MSREIRRVPFGWQHPKRENGSYQPMFDKDYKAVKDEWLNELKEWQEGTHEDYDPEQDYWEYYGNPPDRDFYRPTWETVPDCYQVYEDVSEGTPVSPVFETQDEMKEWLLAEGYSEFASEKFIEHGWAPSGVVFPGKGFVAGIHALDFLQED